MITIGLGKKEGAVACHSAVNKREGVKGLFEYLPLMAMAKLKEGNIIAGLGLVRSQPRKSVRKILRLMVCRVWFSGRECVRRDAVREGSARGGYPGGGEATPRARTPGKTPQTALFCVDRRNGMLMEGFR